MLTLLFVLLGCPAECPQGELSADNDDGCSCAGDTYVVYDNGETCECSDSGIACSGGFDTGA